MQVSRESEMRHSRPTTFCPRRRPSSNHTQSPINVATTVIAITSVKLSFPLAASSPAPTTIGVVNTGIPRRSTKLARKSVMYPCSIRVWTAIYLPSQIGFCHGWRGFAFEKAFFTFVIPSVARDLLLVLKLSSRAQRATCFSRGAIIPWCQSLFNKHVDFEIHLFIEPLRSQV